MYINLFVAGIFATLGAEILIFIIFCIYTAWKADKNNGGKN